jgi:hypothetical protein
MGVNHRRPRRSVCFVTLKPPLYYHSRAGKSARRTSGTFTTCSLPPSRLSWLLGQDLFEGTGPGAVDRRRDGGEVRQE